jgi:NTE family protein
MGMSVKSSTHEYWNQFSEENVPIGLALSAGGARGAYQMGCWKAFREIGLEFDTIAGASIGALNGALMCQGDWSSAYELWMNISRAAIFGSNPKRLLRLAGRAAYDISLFLIPIPKIWIARYVRTGIATVMALSRDGALRQLAREGLIDLEVLMGDVRRYLDMEKLLRCPTPLYVNITGPAKLLTPTGTSESFKLQDLDIETAWKALAASMSLPVAFGKVELDGKSYRDGGLTQWLPVDTLYKQGCRKIVAVSTKTKPGLNPRSYKGCDILLITPKKPLGRFPFATFRFTRASFELWMEQGYDDAMKALDQWAKNKRDG